MLCNDLAGWDGGGAGRRLKMEEIQVCNDLEGWDWGRGGREIEDGGNTCLHRADSLCSTQQRLTQHCKASIYTTTLKF